MCFFLGFLFPLENLKRGDEERTDEKSGFAGGC